MKLVVE